MCDLRLCLPFRSSLFGGGEDQEPKVKFSHKFLPPPARNRPIPHPRLPIHSPPRSLINPPFSKKVQLARLKLVPQRYDPPFLFPAVRSLPATIFFQFGGRSNLKCRPLAGILKPPHESDRSTQPLLKAVEDFLSLSLPTDWPPLRKTVSPAPPASQSLGRLVESGAGCDDPTPIRVSLPRVGTFFATCLLSPRTNIKRIPPDCRRPAYAPTG